MPIKISKRYRFEYVCNIPSHIKYIIMQSIKKSVKNLLLDKKEKMEAIENAENSKICDLEELIHIEYI